MDILSIKDSISNQLTDKNWNHAEIVSNKEVILNLNVAPTDDVEIDNEKFQSSTVDVPTIITTHIYGCSILGVYF